MEALLSAVQDALEYTRQQPYTSFILAILAICITTRLLTGQNTSSRSASSLHNVTLPPSAAYWIPYFGHLPQLAAHGDSFLARLRKAYHPNGIFSLHILGHVHTVIWDPALTAALSEQSDESTVVSSEDVAQHLLQTNFAYPQSPADVDMYQNLAPDMDRVFAKFASPASIKQTVEAMTDRLRHNIADFVSFNSQEVDQVPWERLADAYFLEEQQATEADLFDLVRNFVAFTASASLLGTDFVQNFPDIWPPFWRFTDGFMALAADVPKVLPVNRAIAARRAKGQVLRCLDEFETALETVREGVYPGPQWADVDNVSPLLADRVDAVFRKHSLPLRPRASLDFSLLWAWNATANPLVFWSVWRIYADPRLLARIRAEIAPHVRLEQPAVGFGATYASSTRIERVDLDGLLDGPCPLLTSACLETMRLDAGSWRFHKVRKDTVLVGGGGGGGGGRREEEEEDVAKENKNKKWFLPAGTFVHAAYGLHHMDPKAFPNPQKYDAERHLKGPGGKLADRAIDPSKMNSLGKC